MNPGFSVFVIINLYFAHIAIVDFNEGQTFTVGRPAITLNRHPFMYRAYQTPGFRLSITKAAYPELSINQVGKKMLIRREGQPADARLMFLQHNRPGVTRGQVKVSIPGKNYSSIGKTPDFIDDGLAGLSGHPGNNRLFTFSRCRVKPD